MNSRWIAIAAGSLLAPALLVQTAPAQTASDWPSYNRDLASTRYSALKQINAGNVANLAQAWSLQAAARCEQPRLRER